MRSKDAVEGLAAMAHETRLAMCRELRRADGAASHELADRMGIQRTLASHHLRILVQAGIVEQRRDGREIRHHLVGTRLDKLAAFLEGFSSKGR